MRPETTLSQAIRCLRCGCSSLTTGQLAGTTAPAIFFTVCVIFPSVTSLRSALNRRMLRNLLKMDGHLCEEAEDGLDAVSRFVGDGHDVEEGGGGGTDDVMPRWEARVPPLSWSSARSHAAVVSFCITCCAVQRSTVARNISTSC